MKWTTMMIPVKLKEDIKKAKEKISREDKFMVDCAEWKVFNYLLDSFLKDNKRKTFSLI